VQRSAILAAARRVTSAVTPAPREQADAATRIIERHNTPQGGGDTAITGAVTAVAPDAGTLARNDSGYFPTRPSNMAGASMYYGPGTCGARVTEALPAARAPLNRVRTPTALR